MNINPKKLIAKLPLPFWASFYIFLVILTIPVLAYIGTLSKANPGTLTVTINQKTGTADPNPSYTSVFTVVFSEPIDKNTFTNSDITLGGTAPGQQVQSITEASTFNKTTYEVRIQATSAGTITPTIAQELITAEDGAHGTNQASTSTDNSVTYNGEWAPGEFVLQLAVGRPDNPSSFNLVIPTYPGETYNYTVDWGDGTTSSNQTGNATHTFKWSQTASIKISGIFPRIYYNCSVNDDTFNVIVRQWGTNQWSSMENAFACAPNNAWGISMPSVDAPNLTQATSLHSMFKGVGYSDAIHINHWDVSNITDMTDMFGNGSGLSRDNYDATLASWSQQALKSNVTFDAGTSKYCNADAQRQSIITNHAWTINDGGKDCFPRPLVTTGNPTSIGQNNATLRGLTSPKGVTERGFDYGLDTNYGTTTTDSTSLNYAYKSKFGTSGSGNGQFDNPLGIAIDVNGNSYVSDTHNNRIQKFDSEGNYVNQFGSYGSGDGQFNRPSGIAIDGIGNIYVAVRRAPRL